MSIGVGDDFVRAATKTGLWEAKSLFVGELSAIRRLTADWMRKPVADTANNWVTVQEARNGKFLAAVGKETFDVKIRVDLADGKISAASKVETVERECADPGLAGCGDSKPHSIHRQIEMSLEK